MDFGHALLFQFDASQNQMKEPWQEDTRQGSSDSFPACGIQQVRHRNSQLKLSFDADLPAARSHTLVPCVRA